ncbi:hypothetical protein F4558_002779 [Micromonospora profundi]|uniref:hypothetical protein n=1 Tax=Micromonospora profundi TaxID=1420889 RepID=UPI0014394CC5|nr:hypothetical protein [Micromonospora profundi]NJC12953.1 hypothetical protein [Micromonospora profundi]
MSVRRPARLLAGVASRPLGSSVEPWPISAQLVREGSGNEAEWLQLLREHQRRFTEQLTQQHNCLDLITVKVPSYEQRRAAGR